MVLSARAVRRVLNSGRGKTGRMASCGSAKAEIGCTMKFRPTNRLTSGATRFRAIRAFTLIEVLAALTFMAIVIPVAVEGMRIASLAGVVAERKAVAIRIAERVLAEYTTGSSLQGSALTGTIEEGVIKYRWQVETIP